MVRRTLMAAALVISIAAVIGHYARDHLEARFAAAAPETVDPAAQMRAVVRSYRHLAHLSYETAYHSAGRLRRHIQALTAQPSAQRLAAARHAWRDARVDYAQTEVFRFGNWIVDDWETSINAWPVDEGVLDYVTADYAASPGNPLARHNLVSAASVTIDGITLQTDPVSWPQLKFIHGGSDVEANVVLGYHAIEFLLWGQDHNPNGPGQRPWTDFDGAACTSGPHAAPAAHCRRRGRLLGLMAEHLYSELGRMTLNWAGNNPGSYGLHLAEGDVKEGLRRMLFGMIRLAGDELAGERMQVALLSHAPEEEQDCFSDDTHQSLYFNARGIANIYFGRYIRPGGVSPYAAASSLATLAESLDPELAATLLTRFDTVETVMAEIRRHGQQGATFDRLIEPGNTAGHALMTEGIAALQALGVALESLAVRLELGPINPQAPQFDRVSS